jgi:hypothetical protein
MAATAQLPYVVQETLAHARWHAHDLNIVALEGEDSHDFVIVCDCKASATVDVTLAGEPIHVVSHGLTDADCPHAASMREEVPWR